MSEGVTPDLRSLFLMTGRIAVVTGGCGILGQNFAKGLATHGAAVAIWDLGVADPEGVAATLSEETGGG